MDRIAASRSTASVRSGSPPPAPADQTTASCPDSRSARALVSASSTEETRAVAPVASTSATWSGLRITEVTSCPASTSNGARRSAILPCPPMMVTRMVSTLHTARLARVQTSTHHLTIGDSEVRKEFVADHEAQAEREWACLTLLDEHAPGLAPRPLRREDGDRPVIVMSRIAGEVLPVRPLTTGETGDLGAALRRLYDVPVEAVATAGIGPRRYGADVLPGVLVEWLG